MEKIWISKEGNASCILFFNGWGMDQNLIKNIARNGYDVCMFNGYLYFEGLNKDDFVFDRIFAVAWSLGVCAATRILANSELKITRSIAINGTPFAWHDEWGIPGDTFTKTLSFWNEQNRTKFNLRMFGGKANLEASIETLPLRSVENQKRELQFFHEIGNKIPLDYVWDLAIIGKNDLIIPYRSQILYWEGKTKVAQADWPHFPFNLINSWDEIIYAHNS